MIWPYNYIVTNHTKLNEYVLDFFRKIKYDNGGFRDELFDSSFLKLVNRHPTILKKRLMTIYNYLSRLSTAERESICESIELANQIEKICRGEYIPKSFDGNVKGIFKIIKLLFLNLYKQVLDGEAFRELNNITLRDHFNQISDANKDITLCPFCGIGVLKKSEDSTRDQYDHYLSKSLYPYSSINFHNLVPICKECNSFDVKGEKDSLAISTGKLFFPYDSSHKGLKLSVILVKDNKEINEIEWQLNFSTEGNKYDEIESWKTIYSIESRFNGYIKARVKQWYDGFFDFIKNSQADNYSIEEIRKFYMNYLEIEHKLKLDYIRKPVFEALLSSSNIIKAELEASKFNL